MKQVYIENGTVVLPEALSKNSSVLVEGSKIRYVGKDRPPAKAQRIDARGCFISPGFIDCHIHGDPDRIFANEIRFGTTGIVIAESCASFKHIYARTARIKDFINKDPLGRNILGIHIEGPYISKVKAGAQDKRYIRCPNSRELSEIIKNTGQLLKIMTIAPEIKGAISVIRTLVSRGVKPSIGHSNATYDETMAAINNGATYATHLFNAVRSVDDRDPGAATALLLDDRVTAELILDVAHVRVSLFKILLKVKPKDKIILVTDSVKDDPPPGSNKIGNVYRFKGGRIAGSSLTMIKAVENTVDVAGVLLVDAVRFAASNPARALGIQNRKGSIGPNMDADLVVFDKAFEVKLTMIGGKIVYRKKGF